MGKWGAGNFGILGLGTGGLGYWRSKKKNLGTLFIYALHDIYRIMFHNYNVKTKVYFFCVIHNFLNYFVFSDENVNMVHCTVHKLVALPIF